MNIMNRHHQPVHMLVCWDLIVDRIIVSSTPATASKHKTPSIWKICKSSAYKNEKLHQQWIELWILSMSTIYPVGNIPTWIISQHDSELRWDTVDDIPTWTFSQLKLGYVNHVNLLAGGVLPPLREDGSTIRPHWWAKCRKVQSMVPQKQKCRFWVSTFMVIFFSMGFGCFFRIFLILMI